jgi:transposase
MRRGELSDKQWERLRPLLPPQKPNTGRPNLEHRQIINGILWVLRTGAPWRDLPERYGKWTTVSSRFYRWRKAGVWEQVLAQLQAEGDAQSELDWEVHFVDGTTGRPHKHPAWQKKRLQQPRR